LKAGLSVFVTNPFFANPSEGAVKSKVLRFFLFFVLIKAWKNMGSGEEDGESYLRFF